MFPASIYSFKVKQTHQNNVFNLFDVVHIVLVSLLLTLNRFHCFEQVNTGWVNFVVFSKVHFT